MSHIEGYIEFTSGNSKLQIVQKLDELGFGTARFKSENPKEFCN